MTTVGIYIFDDAEVLDVAGPYEVFTTASRMHERDNPAADPLFSVFMVGRARSPVRARAGLIFTPDHQLSDAPPIDVLIIPGGVVAAELERADVIDWIARSAPKARITASVCTGAFLLAKAGLLDGKTATTHWEDIDDLQRSFPSVKVVGDVRWVDEGSIVTSGGISAGIDMSLHLVERLETSELARRTARQMDFDWCRASVMVNPPRQ
ncbi:AraC family transcriptional regulator [Sorangium cellulosum]|uniref:AraC family transcriptional regulator n=1 Tax=Sorangium cellulosum TaxID=56 RepID=A0A2L0F0E1_SORCE|nr:DJ-1/PfpI family protein [Sorangium cellulosum]AUX45027.1 AraC family transcriptional regulator [Sorangium cellulosum]